MLRKNLIKRMIDEDISRKDIADLLGLSEKTTKRKIDGDVDFKWLETLKIKNTYFKNDSYEELFKDQEI